MSRAKNLRDEWFEWPASRFDRFDFQHPSTLDALVEVIASNEPPSVAVLTGERGVGRGFLCDAAAHRLRKDGSKVAVWHLDLDGFEPDDPHPLAAYLRHKVESEERRAEAARSDAIGAVRSAAKALDGVDLLGRASEISATLLSLFVQFEDPLRRFAEGRFAEALSRPTYGQKPPRDDVESLRRFLDAITRDRRLVIHAHDAVALPVTLRRALIHEAERRPERVFLVLSTPPDESADDIAAEARRDPLRIDVGPLDLDGLREVLDLRFAPNEFPDEFVETLLRRTGGWPAALANAMADLVEIEAISNPDDTWRLPEDGLDDERVVKGLSAGLWRELSDRLAEEEPGLRKVLDEFLLSAALCGRHVPGALPLGYMRLDEATREAVIDWIDDVLVEELGWLEDLEYRHPSFPGLNVYAFTNPLLPRVILHERSEYDRLGQAVSLLRFLEQRGTPIVKRGMARMFLSIAEPLDEDDRGAYASRLAWWTGLEDAEALKKKIRRDLETGRVDGETLWQIAEKSESWWILRRLALLEVYTEWASNQEVPGERPWELHMLWAQLLERAGEYEKALEQAERAREIAEDDTLPFALALGRVGEIKYFKGRFEESRSDFERALAIFRRDLGDDHPHTLIVTVVLARALVESGEAASARTLLEDALQSLRRVLGEDHPQTLLALGALGQCLNALGESREALKHQEENLERLRANFGEAHPDTLTVMHNVAVMLGQLGETDRALDLLSECLEKERAVFGDEHPQTLITLVHRHNALAASDPDGDRLAEARREMRELAERSARARAIFERNGVELG